MLFKKLKSKGFFVIEELDFPDSRLDMNIYNEKPTLRSSPSQLYQTFLSSLLSPFPKTDQISLNIVQQ